MSAFMVTHATIDRVLWAINIIDDAGKPTGLKHEDPEELGNRLLAMNADALRARYGERADTALPYRYQVPTTQCGKAECLRALDCFLYQCIEGEVSQCELYRRCELVRECLVEEIICALPAYERAPWDYPDSARSGAVPLMALAKR